MENTRTTRRSGESEFTRTTRRSGESEITRTTRRSGEAEKRCGSTKLVLVVTDS